MVRKSSIHRSYKKKTSRKCWFTLNAQRKTVLILPGVSFPHTLGSVKMAILPMKYPYSRSFCTATLICFTNTPLTEESALPNLFTVSGYKVYFWSNENQEPIHVHISKGKPSANSTKIWLTKTGRCIVANNNSEIPQRELSELMEFISAQFFLICSEWKKHFVTDEISFYC